MKAKRTLLAAATFLVPLLLLGLASCVGVPSLTSDYSHQGRLLTSTGAPVPDGDYLISYRLYHSLTGGSPVYTETKMVAVKGGLFDSSVGLTGELKPDVLAQPTWMEISVKGEVLSPRQRLEGAPYAASLVGGAVVQGTVPITRTFGSYANTGADLTVWNQDSSEKGGNGLIVFNSASATGFDKYNTSAIQAIAADTDLNPSTGGYGAIIRSDNFRGMYVQAGSSWYAAVFSSTVGINLQGGGSCTGCTMAYIAKNGGPDAIQPGDFVAADGVAVDPDLNIPIMLVYRAAAVSDPIIGVAIGAMVRTPVKGSQETVTGGFDSLGGPAGVGQYLNVVVQGLVQVRLEPSASLKIGNWVGVADNRVTSAVGDVPKIARLMSAVDQNGMAWIMFKGQ